MEKRALGKQLDLFDWRPPCQVVAFPHSRLMGRARRIVSLRATKSSADMNAIWDRQLDELEAALIRAGLPDDEQERQLMAFADLVRSEIVRVDYGGARPCSSGDAA